MKWNRYKKRFKPKLHPCRSRFPAHQPAQFPPEVQSDRTIPAIFETMQQAAKPSGSAKRPESHPKQKIPGKNRLPDPGKTQRRPFEPAPNAVFTKCVLSIGQIASANPADTGKQQLHHSPADLPDTKRAAGCVVYPMVHLFYGIFIVGCNRAEPTRIPPSERPEPASIVPGTTSRPENPEKRHNPLQEGAA